MLNPSFLPAMLTFLVAHTLIQSTIAMEAIPSAADGFNPDALDNIHLPWPSYLPGWGALTIHRDLLAEEYDMGLVHPLGVWDVLPRVYTISRPGNDTCDNPGGFPHTRAVDGTLCLPEGVEYESVIKNVTGLGLPEPGAAKQTCGCFCKCELGCIASLILWPFCVAGCTACPDR